MIPGSTISRRLQRRGNRKTRGASIQVYTPLNELHTIAVSRQRGG